MSFDGIVTRAVVSELNKKITSGRIDKIYQQEKDEILINIHCNKKNFKLLISASSNNPRIYLTNHSKKNPSTPPMFCMLLRKHLTGGIILDIRQAEMDRVIFIDISTLDELNQKVEKTLVVEIMGKHSNIILVNKDDSKIIDSIKRIREDISRVRQIFPGLKYSSPPNHNKKNPLIVLKEEFLRDLDSEEKSLKIYKFFYLNYIGLSPLISREICFLSDLDIDRNIGSLSLQEKEGLYFNFSHIISLCKKNDFSPIYIINENQELFLFYSLFLKGFSQESIIKLDSISEVLDISFKKRDNYDRISQKSQNLKKTISIKLDRNLNKLGKQRQELLASKDRDKYKVYADLISANIHLIPKGSESISLDNFYDENLKKINIPLDKKISPIDNAQRYYKKYSKLKTAENLLKVQIPETEDEIDYLENILFSIENSQEVEELDDIREELVIQGYLKDTSKTKKKRKERKDGIISSLEFISKDGIKIYVGKNNKQNDYLTMKFANKDDIWLHVQKMPGSHVIIKKSTELIPETTLEEAAILAAYYSKAKNSNNVAIDYTEKKNVKKSKNAKPGMVIYENFKTIYVSPSLELFNKIKKA